MTVLENVKVGDWLLVRRFNELLKRQVSRTTKTLVICGDELRFSRKSSRQIGFYGGDFVRPRAEPFTPENEQKFLEYQKKQERNTIVSGLLNDLPKKQALITAEQALAIKAILDQVGGA